jgi:hypothetical protein
MSCFSTKPGARLIAKLAVRQTGLRELLLASQINNLLTNKFTQHSLVPEPVEGWQE